MSAAAGPRKISIYDYPEHLNPFREDDRNIKTKFGTIGKRLSRSNSINFSIKDLKNSWALRSFMKKRKKPQPPPSQLQENKSNQVNGDSSSPVVFRRALQYSSTSAEIEAGAGFRNTSPLERPPRYVYGGSVTPLPRSRFQERLRSSSQHEVSSLSATPRMARSEISGSRFSMESSNPFEECPIPPVRASRRKKKRAAPLPPNGVVDVSISSEISELRIIEDDEKKDTEPNDKTTLETDLDLKELNMHVDLKIVEDEEINGKAKEPARPPENTKNENSAIVKATIIATEPTKQIDNQKQNDKPMPKQISANKENNIFQTNNENHNEVMHEDISDSKEIHTDLDNNMNAVSFPKVNIVKYRRNSSVNEDDIRLRRGNSEDLNAVANQDITCDINMNEKNNNTSTTKDSNCNDGPQKVVCKVYDATSRKHSVETISSTEKEFIEIDKVRREFESEINKLNSALENDFATGARLSVSEIKRKYDKSDMLSPNPIPKPRRSHYGELGSPGNGNVQT